MNICQRKGIFKFKKINKKTQIYIMKFNFKTKSLMQIYNSVKILIIMLTKNKRKLIIANFYER